MLQTHMILIVADVYWGMEKMLYGAGRVVHFCYSFLEELLPTSIAKIIRVLYRVVKV